MKKIIYYVMALVTYMFIAILIYLFTPMIGDKILFYNTMFIAIALWVFTIFIFENKTLLSKNTYSIRTLLNYFDFNSVKEILKIERKKKEYYKIFSASKDEKNVIVFQIKMLNLSVLDKLDKVNRLDSIAKVLEVIEKNIKEKYGIIYNIDGDLITCAFNTLYEIDDIELNSIIAALKINLDFMQLRKENKIINKLRFNMALAEEKLDFFIKNKRVMLYGNMNHSKNIVNIDGVDDILIDNSIYKKCENRIDTDYMGKFYFEEQDEKVYKVIKVLDDEVEKVEKTYIESKISIKKGKQKKLQKEILKIKNSKNRK